MKKDGTHQSYLQTGSQYGEISQMVKQPFVLSYTYEDKLKIQSMQETYLLHLY